MSHFAEHRIIFGGAHAQRLSRGFFLGPKKPPILHCSLLPTMVGHNEKNVFWSRPPPNNIVLSHLLIKNDPYIDWMKILPKDIFWWSLYSSIYMKTSSCYILRFYVGLFNCCSIWKFDICGWHLDTSIPHSWYDTTGSVLIGRPALSEMTPWLRSPVLLEPIWAQVGQDSWPCHTQNVAVAPYTVHSWKPKVADELVVVLNEKNPICLFKLSLYNVPLAISSVECSNSAKAAIYVNRIFCTISCFLSTNVIANTWMC